MKNLNFYYSLNFYINLIYLLPSVCLSYTSEHPFADWWIEVEIFFLFWKISFSCDNSLKYYPRKKSKA